jgi:hypothetical protein
LTAAVFRGHGVGNNSPVYNYLIVNQVFDASKFRTQFPIA